MFHFFRVLGAVLVAWSLGHMGVQAAQVYTWVDDKGVTHFEAHPPAGQAAKLVDPAVAPMPSGEAPAPVAAQPEASSTANDPKQQGIDRQVRQQVAEQEAEREEACTKLRTRLAQLNNNPRIKLEDLAGQVRRLPEEERQKLIKDTEQRISEHCL